MLEADLEMASLANTGIGKRQSLLATLDRAGRFLLFLGIAVSRLCVPCKQHLLLVSTTAGGLNGGRAGLADDDLSAVVIGFGALVGLVRAVLQTKNLDN